MGKKIKVIVQEHMDMRDMLDHMSNAFYKEVDPRRRQEIADSRMVNEDQMAMANLSPRFIHKQFDQNRFKYDQNSAGSPDWEKSEVGPAPFFNIFEE